VELEFSRKLSQAGGASRHEVLYLDLRQIGGNPLTSDTVDVPSADDEDQARTVVPFRNMLFVTLTAAYAEVHGISDLYLSPVRDDFAAYRDCRREFYDSLEQSLQLGATRDTPVHIHTPFIQHWKSDIVKLGLSLGVPYENTHTCYEGRRPACGVCDACAERIAAFRLNGASDPLVYEIPIDWTP
jgi:7-cyano-7-deazaguanine synthase